MTIFPAQWLIQKQVIFGYAYGDITNAEMEAYNKCMVNLLNTSNHAVHVLFVTHPDSQLSSPSIASGRRILSYMGHHNLNWNVAVNNPKLLLGKLSVILAQVARVRYRQFTYVDDALHFLKEIDDTLDWSKADWAKLDVITDHQPPDVSAPV